METNHNKEQIMVQDRKTGEWYDPHKKFEELKSKQWFVDLLKRMKDK